MKSPRTNVGVVLIRAQTYVLKNQCNPRFSFAVIRWCQHNKEVQALKAEVKANNTLIVGQSELLEEIARNAKVKPGENL